MTKVNKGELAKKIGKSGAIVTRLINDGVLNSSFTPDGKKIFLEKAIHAIIMNKGRDYISVDIDIELPKIEKENTALYTVENLDELQELLDQEPSPSKKIEMMDKFWSYKIRKQKFLEAEGELLSVHDAKVAIDSILSPLNQYLNDMGNNLKNHFPDIENEFIEWINEENNRQKEHLKVKEWD